MAVYLNANSSSDGQSVAPTDEIVVIKMLQATVASQADVFDKAISAFVAPSDGVYRVAGGTIFSGGNADHDGVIMGFSINKQNPFPPVSPDLSTTNILVLEPGTFINPTSQSVTALLQLKKGNTVQLALSGIQSAKFEISYSYLSVNSV